MPDSLGDAAQTRAIVDQAAKATAAIAISEFIAGHPELFAKPEKADIPAPLKWASAILASLFVMGIGATATWLVSTTNETQLAVSRIEERVKFISEMQTRDVDDLKRRVDLLEQELRGSAK